MTWWYEIRAATYKNGFGDDGGRWNGQQAGDDQTAGCYQTRRCDQQQEQHRYKVVTSPVTRVVGQQTHHDGTDHLH